MVEVKMQEVKMPVSYQMASQRPILAPPNGKPLIVHVVVNIELWRYDRAMPRKLIPAPHGIEKIPDMPNYSWAEYGMRSGFPRILKVLKERGLRASTSINAGIIDAYPACAEAMLTAGWEFIVHGIEQRAVKADEDEEALISRATEKVKNFTGVQPRGWLAPGMAETFNTPELLKKAGYDYDCDWPIDDLPCWIPTNHGPLIALPYILEINDSLLHAVQQKSSPEMHQRLVDTLEIFDEELKIQPRILSLGLHPHLIGVPHRIGYLARMLDLLKERQDTIFMTGSQIADWFITADATAKKKE